MGLRAASGVQVTPRTCGCGACGVAGARSTAGTTACRWGRTRCARPLRARTDGNALRPRCLLAGASAAASTVRTASLGGNADNGAGLEHPSHLEGGARDLEVQRDPPLDRLILLAHLDEDWGQPVDVL